MSVKFFFRPQQRFLISPSLESEGVGRQMTEQLGWIGLEERQRDADTSAALSSQIYMPGSGIAKRLYLHWSVGLYWSRPSTELFNHVA